MKLYTMEEMKYTIDRKKKVSDILKVSEAIGYNNKEVNKQILGEIVRKNYNVDLKDNTEIST